MKILMLSMVLLSGCGAYVDPQLAPYVEEFLRDGNMESPIVLTVQFKPVFNNSSWELAECDNNIFSNRVISVDPQMWKGLNEVQRKVLMYHELGHCILGLGHDNNLKDDGMPESVMYFESEKVAEAFQTSPGEYLDQLFGRGQTDHVQENVGGRE